MGRVKSWWIEFLIGMVGALAICLVILGLLGQIDERDRRITRLENARTGCVPVREREIAAAQMKKDGTIECAISAPMGGRRFEIYRVVY